MEFILGKEEYRSIKESFYNIFAAFLGMENVKEDFIDCIFKWGVQLDIDKKELYSFIGKPETVKFIEPADEKEALEHVYDLVYMIYLDGEVEDIELEVTTEYAKMLGFKPHIVNDLLKAIVTAPYDGLEDSKRRGELKQIIDDVLSQ
ncbi:hypothetical protein QQ008_23935 [Fulvivirgaceae bacterium BMA10]|uniref:TerB family tellurite resistance protein n=1 Tax=Splendidivirga corallicola TaxID=3051826 RepID=A0ABT8KYH6_9BACT|nr:hypothetical protein [Fulvivirgaceae bacterium BMA10]